MTLQPSRKLARGIVTFLKLCLVQNQSRLVCFVFLICFDFNSQICTVGTTRFLPVLTRFPGVDPESTKLSVQQKKKKKNNHLFQHLLKPSVGSQM